MMYARAMMLFGALALFMNLQGCGQADPKAKDGKAAAGKGNSTGGKASPPLQPVKRGKGPSPTLSKAMVSGGPRKFAMAGPQADFEALPSEIHEDAADKMLAAANKFHKAAQIHEKAAKAAAMQGPDLSYDPYAGIPDDHYQDSYMPHLADPYAGIPDEPNYMPSGSKKYMDSYKPYSSSKAFDVYDDDMAYSPPPVKRAKQVQPKRTGYTARKEKAPVGGPHYTSVQISAPAGASLSSKVSDRGNGDVQATQINHNMAAEGATTNVQSGPPHQEHVVDVVTSASGGGY